MMLIFRPLSWALALSCGMSFAAAAPLDFFGRPVEFESRLTAPDSARSVDPRGHEGAGAPPGWGLLPAESRYAGADPVALAVGNISGQNRPDVVIATSYFVDPATDYHLLLFRPDNTTSFLPPLLYPYGQTPNLPSLAVVDLDGSHGSDVVVGGDRGITRFRATAQGTLVATAPESTQLAMALATVDLNRDGWKDIVSISWSDNGRIHRNLGNGSLLATPWSPPVQGYNTIGQGDIDGDGLVDVVVGSGQGAGPHLHLYRNTGKGTLAPLQSLSGICPGGHWGGVGGVGIGDINGDGHADIVAASGGNSPSSCVMIFHADGNGGFEAAIYFASYDIPQTLRVADIDGDGRADVIVVHGGWRALGVYLQQENGSLAPERLFPIPYSSSYSAHSFEVVDLDQDGCADVALVDFNNGFVTLRGTRCGILFASGFE